MLEKKGLHQAAGILENYGIDSETNLSMLDQDDFNKLSSRGLKPLHIKNLDLWCDDVCERASKTEVVKAYAHTIVAPAMDYWKQTIEGKKGDQLERMKSVRIFNPLHVLGRSP